MVRRRNARGASDGECGHHPAAVTVAKLKDMDFGYVAVTTAGTAVLEPNADSSAPPAA